MSPVRITLALCIPLIAPAQPVETVRVVSDAATRSARLPAELKPYLQATLRARVNGFVERMEADVGSTVRAGQVLARISAPELTAQIVAAEARVSETISRRAEAEARLANASSVLQRLRTAAQTPGVIAANELVIAENDVKAAQATVASIDAAAEAARSAVRPLRDLEAYLEVPAPFDGVITDRLAHPGALVGPESGVALYELQQVSRLRLVVAVPEAAVASVGRGGTVKFRVPAYSGRDFSASIARVSHSLDPKTRTMAVEADVTNASGALAPGMFAEVAWTVRPRGGLLVPPTAVVTTTARSFVTRVRGGKAEWVDVAKGPQVGELVEVVGALAPGDEIVRRGSDEIRDGAPLSR